MREDWYVAIDESPSGPHARSVVVQMRRSGKISSRTLVWCDGMADWAPYARAGLDEPATPPDLPRATPIPKKAPVRQSVTLADGADGRVPMDVPSSSLSLPSSSSLSPRRDISDDISAWAAERLSRPGSNSVNAAFSHLPPLEVEDDGWQSVKPAPWSRYFARTLDTILMGAFLWAAVAIISAGMGSDFFQTLFARRGLLGVPVVSSVIVAASLIPVQALLLGMSGTTIGKWLFGIRITRRDGRAIGIPAALGREAYVFAFGIGCGIGILWIIASIVGYRVLSETGSTNWDKGKDWVVTQRTPGVLQTIMFIAGLLVLFVVILLVEKAAGIG